MFGLFSPAKPVIPPTKPRLRAAWLLLPIGTLMMLVGACLPSVIGLVSLFLKTPEAAASQSTAANQAGFLTTLSIVLFVGLEALGVTFLVCRRKILQAGHASAIVALVLAGVLAAAILTLIIGNLSNLITQAKETAQGIAGLTTLGVILGLVWNFAIVLSLLLLIYFLIKVVRERKPLPPLTTPPPSPPAIKRPLN